MQTFLMIILMMISTVTYASPVSLKYNDHARSVMLDRFDGVKEHLYEASVTTGINMAELTAIASLESKLQSNVKNPQPGASASGILQYTNRTWKAKRKQYGQELGVSPTAHQYNLRANLLIGGRDLQDTKLALLANTHLTTETLTLGDVYMSHVLGEGGAIKLINSYSHKPMNQIVKIHPGNYRYYYKPNGQIRTAREFRQFMDHIAKVELKVYEVAIAKYQVAKFFEPFQDIMDSVTTPGSETVVAAILRQRDFG